MLKSQCSGWIATITYIICLFTLSILYVYTSFICCMFLYLLIIFYILLCPAVVLCTGMAKLYLVGMTQFFFVVLTEGI